ncbi:MAG TPA: hypothetical protein VND95_04915 [Stellaceae bacterium]|nr:hypothetical protein [Stellaceae bacterium]
MISIRPTLKVAAAAVLFALLTGCAAQRAAGPPGHPDVIVVRQFAFSPGVITLDPSFGYSLNHGIGVTPLRRADSVGRAAAFNLADTATQELRSFGYDAVDAAGATPDTGGRALVVTGAFRRIYEGHRRENASVTVAVEIDELTAGAAPQRLTAFDLDSRRLVRREALPGVSERHGNDVNYAAMQLGATIAHYVDDLARLNNWGKAAR